MGYDVEKEILKALFDKLNMMIANDQLESPCLSDVVRIFDSFGEKTLVVESIQELYKNLLSSEEFGVSEACLDWLWLHRRCDINTLFYSCLTGSDKKPNDARIDRFRFLYFTSQIRIIVIKELMRGMSHPNIRTNVLHNSLLNKMLKNMNWDWIACNWVNNMYEEAKEQEDNAYNRKQHNDHNRKQHNDQTNTT